MIGDILLTNVDCQNSMEVFELLVDELSVTSTWQKAMKTNFRGQICEGVS